MERELWTPDERQSDWFEVRPELVVNLATATRLTVFPEGAKEGNVKLLLWHGATDTVLMDWSPIEEIMPMRDEILRRLGVLPMPPRVKATQGHDPDKAADMGELPIGTKVMYKTFDSSLGDYTERTGVIGEGNIVHQVAPTKPQMPEVVTFTKGHDPEPRP